MEIDSLSELNTFSVVAQCPRTGQLGVAVSTAVPAVGSMCPFIRAKVGAVSTQSWVNPYLAINALRLIELGQSAQQALDQVLAQDDAREYRQLGVVDHNGFAAAWTGSKCTGWHGHILGEHFSVQGNMLTGAEVIQAMANSMRTDKDLSLDERLMRTLEAGQQAGGDKRGKQSAALKIYETEEYALLDIRADEHAQPIEELRRIFEIAKLQLLPFTRAMPKKHSPAMPAPDAVVKMLALSPSKRPGGGDSQIT